jgi:C4-dicarboxylate-specific signal transduction histidine kinase
MKITILKRAVLLPNSPFVPPTFLSPFFTTKPTGQLTGLELSLSYDIVKAHGGVLKVETKGREVSVFKIQIPVS